MVYGGRTLGCSSNVCRVEICDTVCGRSIHEHVLRPLILCGRILLPTVDELRDGSETFWRSVPVMRQPVLNAANMLKTADMLTIEDVSECALPRTTDVDTRASQ